MSTRIVIRDIHRYGQDLTAWQAIARLCDGTPVTVTVTDPAPPGGDPRGVPRTGYDIQIRPPWPCRQARAQSSKPHIACRAPETLSAGDAAWYAEALTLAAALAAALADRAGPRPGYVAQAAAIGAAHGRDAARRALAGTSPGYCRGLITRLEAGDEMVYDLYETPALGGEHGIRYGHADLAADLGLDPGEDPALHNAGWAYFDQAGDAFWTEAERLARDRAAQDRPAPGQPGSRIPAQLRP